MIKKLLGNVLKKVANSMITVAPASCADWGIEEMPESMKKLR
jgi:hypothetical protein